MSTQPTAAREPGRQSSLERFSTLGLERTLGLLPWLAVTVVWVVLAAVHLLLLLLQPDAEMGQVVAWLLPISFLVVVPGLGGGLCFFMRLRRARTDTGILEQLQGRIGGQIHTGSLLRPMVRPRVLARVDDVPVEVVLSPPIPRTPQQAGFNPERAVAESLVNAAAEAMETPGSQLGTAAWPQLELRVGVDLPFWLHLGTSPHLGRFASRLQEVPTSSGEDGEGVRVLSDQPQRAAALLTHNRLRATLFDAVRFNHPWATQLLLRPAAQGRGAGAYLLSVAADRTSAESLAGVIHTILEVCSDQAWRPS